MVGHKMSTLLGRKAFVQDLKPKLDQCLQGKRIHFQHWLTPPGGKNRFWDVRYEPATGENGEISGIIIVVRDVTSQKRAEEALQKAQFALENAPEGVFFMTREAGFSYVNEHACKSLGYKKDELLKLNLWDIDPVFPKENWDVIWTQAQESPVSTVNVETIHRRKDGTEFPVEVSAKHLRHADREFHVAFVRDITDRKKAEEKRLDLEKQVQYAQKLESLGVLAGGIAHDFNNLLTSILGYSDLAQLNLPRESPIRGYMEEVVKGTRQAAALTQQMLAYSGKGKFVVQPHNLNEIVKDMDRLLEISISKNCVLKYAFVENLPSIEADAAQVRQIIMNLVINASDAIGDRSGVIAVHTGVMPCDSAYLSESYLSENLSEGLYVFLEISDNGLGMSVETQARLFDPFFTTKFTGRGLGLAAVLGIVRGHRGTIKVSSKEGKGSTFKVLFPASKKKAMNSGFSEREDLGWQGSGKALIIDDEESVRGLAGEMLEKMGFA
ncbi:MAG TPA: PAS domain S-box protein, partial [Nitrospiria bacterium]|nr:PAS domain S-box protein [Nitrospiria bacterium]